MRDRLRSRAPIPGSACLLDGCILVASTQTCPWTVGVSSRGGGKTGMKRLTGKRKQGSCIFLQENLVVGQKNNKDR